MTTGARRTMATGRRDLLRYVLAGVSIVLATLATATAANAAAAVPRDLYEAAKLQPGASFAVIVQGDGRA